jgi:hypothetical protein
VNVLERNRGLGLPSKSLSGEARKKTQLQCQCEANNELLRFSRQCVGENGVCGEVASRRGVVGWSLSDFEEAQLVN